MSFKKNDIYIETNSLGMSQLSNSLYQFNLFSFDDDDDVSVRALVHPSVCVGNDKKKCKRQLKGGELSVIQQ